MATLYEINHQIYNLIDNETGEITDEKLFDELHIAREEKLENIALFIKNLKADVKALKEEEDVFKKRRQVAENKIRNLTEYLQYSLAGNKFKTSKVDIGYRKSTAVNITNLDAIPKEYLKETVKIDPDKTALKQAILEGEIIDGCELVENQNIQIK